MVVELSHTFSPGMPKLPILPDMEMEAITSIAGGAALNISSIRLALHVGTHIDAPRHIVPDGASIDQISPERLMGYATVSAVSREPGEVIEVEDILKGGPEPQAGDALLIFTGWGSKFHGSEYADHPSLSPELAKWSVERGLSMVGVDMSTPDLPLIRRDATFNYEIHRTLLGNGVLIAENLCNLDKVSGQRVRLVALPLPIAGGDAGPARILVQ